MDAREVRTSRGPTRINEDRCPHQRFHCAQIRLIDGRHRERWLRHCVHQPTLTMGSHRPSVGSVCITSIGTADMMCAQTTLLAAVHP